MTRATIKKSSQTKITDKHAKILSDLSKDKIDQICKRAESELVKPINLDYLQVQTKMIQASKKLFDDFS